MVVESGMDAVVEQRSLKADAAAVLRKRHTALKCCSDKEIADPAPDLVRMS